MNDCSSSDRGAFFYMEEGLSPKEAATKWIEGNGNKVDQWLTKKGIGEMMSLTLLPGSQKLHQPMSLVKY